MSMARTVARGSTEPPGAGAAVPPTVRSASRESTAALSRLADRTVATGPPGGSGHRVDGSSRGQTWSAAASSSRSHSRSAAGFRGSSTGTPAAWT
jgi:hypothetical protein